MSNLIGEIKMFGGSSEPANHVFCNGQLLNVNTYSDLFSLFGTSYGGDGIVTFGVPDLRGRIVLHEGQGVGLTNRIVGNTLGVETVVLSEAELPVHNHSFQADTSSGASSSPVGKIIAASSADLYAAGTKVQMNTGIIETTGNSQSHANIMPFLSISFIVVTTGVLPV